MARKQKVKKFKNTGSWTSNPMYLFMFRLTRMHIGDALISDDDTWRVDCVRDNTTPLRSMYLVYENGKLTLTRKRPSAVSKYLVSHGAPQDLNYYEDRALFAGSGYEHFRTFDVGIEFDTSEMKEYWAEFTHLINPVYSYYRVSRAPRSLLDKGRLGRQMTLFPFPEQAIIFIWKKTIDQNRVNL